MKDLTFDFNKQTYQLKIRSQADNSVYKEIFELREYKDIENLLKSAQAPIIDAGAQAGFFVLYCRSFNKQVPIFAVEPDEENFLALEDNLQLNQITDVELIPAALSAKSGLRDFYVSADTHNHGLFKVLIPKITQTKKIKTFSLADFLQNNNINKVSLLKLDIEGAEYEVLNNFTEWQQIDNVILEYHQFADFSSEQLITLLQSQGFRTRSLASKFDPNLGFIIANKN